MKKFITITIAIFFAHFVNAQALAVTTSQVNVLCYGGNNGSATANPTGGTPPYTYSWSPTGQITQTANNLTAGTYIVYVTDNVSAQVSATLTITQPPLLQVNFSSTSATCSNSNGSLTLNASGGTPNYTYSWCCALLPVPTQNNLGPGSYTATVTDSHGCTTSGTAVVTNQAGPSLSVSNITNVTCNSLCNGSITMTGSAGTPPYQYSWTNSQMSNMATNLCPGPYSCTITDANGCTATASATITQPTALSANVSLLNPTCNSACNGVATITASGGTPQYTYTWDNGVVPANVCCQCAGTHTLVLTDANGCSVGPNIYSLTDPPGLTAPAGTIIPSGCNVSSGSATVNAAGGTPPYTYSWNTTPSQSTATATSLGNGTYLCTITDVNGCSTNSSAVVGDSCNYVWPGDANEDAVADNNDILEIGVLNGATGTTRANATTNWIGQPSTDWGQTQTSGADYKFADCDGDGTIANADTNAVVQNFGLTHNMRTIAPPPYNATLPDLSVTMNQSQLASNSPGSLTISLGNSSVPANNIYGLAFTLNFDPNQIDAGTFAMNENGSWMGTTGTNLMGVKLSQGTGSGSVQVAIVRYDHTNVSGFGNIAQMGFMTTNALTGTGNSQEVHFTISNVNVIDANEISQQVNAVNDSVDVVDSQVITSVPANSDNSVSIFPNPVQNDLIVTLQNSSSQNIIRLYNASGQLVREENFSGTKYTLQRGDLAAGLYSLEIITEKNVVVKKVLFE